MGASPFFNATLEDVPEISSSFDGVWTVLYRDNSKAQVTFAPYTSETIKTTALVHLAYSNDNEYFPKDQGWYMAETLYNEKGGVGDTWAFFRSTQGSSVEIEAFGKHCVREYRYEKKFYCSSGYAIPGEYLITYLINELVGKWKISNESGGSPSKLAISTSGRLNDGKQTTSMKLSNN